jgi:hypothetical protein
MASGNDKRDVDGRCPLLPLCVAYALDRHETGAPPLAVGLPAWSF